MTAVRNSRGYGASVYHVRATCPSPPRPELGGLVRSDVRSSSSMLFLVFVGMKIAHHMPPDDCKGQRPIFKMYPWQQGLINVPEELGNLGVLDAGMFEQKHGPRHMAIRQIVEVDGCRILGFLILHQKTFGSHRPKRANELHCQVAKRKRVVSEPTPESTARATTQPCFEEDDE